MVHGAVLAVAAFQIIVGVQDGGRQEFGIYAVQAMGLGGRVFALNADRFRYAQRVAFPGGSAGESPYREYQCFQHRPCCLAVSQAKVRFLFHIAKCGARNMGFAVPLSSFHTNALAVSLHCIPSAN